MKKNYRAWQIKYDDFFKLPVGKERLKFLIKFGILAPSSHNVQPWKFEVTENCILIKPEQRRLLPISDPDNRHLYIALGCVLENLLVAADYYGLSPLVEYLPADQKDSAVKISLKTDIEKKLPEKHLALAIASRKSNRSRYTAKAPEAEFLSNLQNFAMENIQISVVTDSDIKNKIADLLMESRYAIFGDKLFRGEMADYKKTNFTFSSFGMPGFSQGLSNITSIISPFLIRHTNIMKKVGKFEEALLKQFTPVFVFVNSKNQTSLEWLYTGQILEKILLESEAQAIQIAPSAVPKNTKPLQEALETNYFPQIFLRMGYAENVPPHTPRLDAAKTIEGLRR